MRLKHVGLALTGLGSADAGYGGGTVHGGGTGGPVQGAGRHQHQRRADHGGHRGDQERRGQRLQRDGSGAGGRRARSSRPPAWTTTARSSSWTPAWPARSTDAQRAAFEAYFKKGGGFVGVGSAIETDPSWSFLTDALGTRASGRTAVQTGTVKVFDRVHDASKNLPEYWDRTDAFYNFTTNVRGALARAGDGGRGPVRPAAGRQHARRHRRRHDGRQPSDLLLQGLPGRPRVLHRRWATRRPASTPALTTHLKGAIAWAAGQIEPDLQRLRRDGARELPGDQGLRPAEPGRADQLRPVPRRSHHPDRAPGHRAPARPGQGHDDGPRRLRVGQPAVDDADLHQPGGRPLRRRDRQRLRARTTGSTSTTRRRPSPTSSSRRVEVVTQTTPNTNPPNAAASLTAWDPYVGLLPALALQVRRGRARRAARWTWTPSSRSCA